MNEDAPDNAPDYVPDEPDAEQFVGGYEDLSRGY